MRKYFIIFIALLIGCSLYFSPRSYIVQGESMWPTLKDGQRVVSADVSIGRGDLVVFYNGRYIVKRVIGIPGDSVYVTGNSVYVNNVKLEENYLKKKFVYRMEVFITLAENEYFVMGDNRDASTDSRHHGPIPVSFIKGKVIGY